jgi:Rod binding domain-containing protein
MIAIPAGSQTLPALAAAEARGADNAAKAFEAVLLRQALEMMLPKAAQSGLGGGFAGETWRSFLAERLADAIAQRGGVGIAQTIGSTLAVSDSGQAGTGKDS